jgi:hypothetical protein
VGAIGGHDIRRSDNPFPAGSAFRQKNRQPVRVFLDAGTMTVESRAECTFQRRPAQQAHEVMLGEMRHLFGAMVIVRYAGKMVDNTEQGAGGRGGDPPRCGQRRKAGAIYEAAPFIDRSAAGSNRLTEKIEFPHYFHSAAIDEVGLGVILGLGPLFNQDMRHAVFAQEKRCHETDGPGAHDDDISAVGNLPSCLFTMISHRKPVFSF